MAINLDDRYPGRANPKTLNYPQGSFKNRSSPTSKDGTYLEQDWANDMLGFFQAMMKNAGISANGNVDTAQASQYLDSLIQTMRSTHATETEFGSGKLATTAQAQALVADDVVITPKKLGDAFKGANYMASPAGYQRLPSGLLLQWINTTVTVPAAINSKTTASVVFPISFSELYQVIVSQGAGDQAESGELAYGIDTNSNSGASATVTRVSGGNASGNETTLINFFAIGR